MLRTFFPSLELTVLIGTWEINLLKTLLMHTSKECINIGSAETTSPESVFELEKEVESESCRISVC